MSAAGLTYCTVPVSVTTITTSVACCTKARKRASLSPISARAWLESSTSRTMRQATPIAATPVMIARVKAALEPESSRMTTAGAANSAAPSTTMRARSRRTGLGSPSHRLRIDGCITAAASRK